MTIVVSAIFLLLFVVMLAVLGNEGLWSNVIVVVNLTLAALVATNFWEPLTAYFVSNAPSYVCVWDILAIWGIFAVAYGLMRFATDSISRTRVRFPKLVDLIGGYVFAVFAGWVLVCFVAMTLHLAPMSRNYLFDGFQPESHMFFGTAPDRQWLAFMQKMSLGTFSRGGAEGQGDSHVFDPRGELIPKYATRRAIMQSGTTVRQK